MTDTSIETGHTPDRTHAARINQVMGNTRLPGMAWHSTASGSYCKATRIHNIA